MLEEKPKNRLGKPSTPSDTPSGGGASTAATRQAQATDSATSGPIHPPSIHNRVAIVAPPVGPPNAAAEPPEIETTPAEPAHAEPAGVEVAAGPNRAGRDLPIAIAVGVGLGAAIIISLAVYRPAFLVILLAAVLISVWELSRALRSARVRPPLVPLLLGSVAIIAVSWLSGRSGLAVTTILTVLAVLVWRLSDGPVGYWRDASTAVLITVYVPLLAGFAVLMLRPDDGATRIAAFIVTVVCSDVGGYVAGVLFGRHPMSATISPKKSWEGLGGSVLACMIAGVLMVGLALDGSWWQGVLFGAAIAVTATLGDLGESIVKRDLGIKDMGRLLPGHGGLMDRMDSLLPSAAVAYLLLTLFVPPVIS
ncbi:hypothetical protein BH24ACT9_BH24ACT9_16120 [soil metagenome]